jgi:hypothetical protein
MTDDRSARKLATSVYPGLKVRTTSHLVGWLVYVAEFSDSDVSLVIDENRRMRGKDSIEPYVRKCYEYGMMLRLMQRNNTP